MIRLSLPKSSKRQRTTRSTANPTMLKSLHRKKVLENTPFKFSLMPKKVTSSAKAPKQHSTMPLSLSWPELVTSTTTTMILTVPATTSRQTGLKQKWSWQTAPTMSHKTLQNNKYNKVLNYQLEVGALVKEF